MYHYLTQRQNVFTESGTGMLLEIRAIAQKCIEVSGAVLSAKLFVAGDSWDALACMDYLVERGELREVTAGQNVAGQSRVFVAGSRWKEPR
jgi:hypothetical protein